MTLMLQKKSIFIALLLALFVAGGCTTVNLSSQDAPTAAAAIQLAAARASSDPKSAQTYLLRTADKYQQQDDHESAREILTSAPLRQPLEELNDQYLLLAMGSASALDDQAWAVRIVKLIDTDQFKNYADDLQLQAAQLQASMYRLAQRPLDEAQTLVQLTPEELGSQTQEIYDTLWLALKRVPDNQLAEERQRSIGYNTQGWLELASILRLPGQTLEAQSKAIRQWQSNWQDHPATATLPSELQLITSLLQDRPGKIALALPLSGPLAGAGAAIRDGFLAAFYDDRSNAELEFEVEISVHDTFEASFDSLYRELVAAGSDLIVGPLDKGAVASINRIENLPVPVLALNYLDQSAEPAKQLYQFGLAAEDEARQIAQRLSEDQVPQVLVLIPKGEWGDRFETALVDSLTTHNGTALKIERFFSTDNLRQVTADLFGINQSRERAIDVERTIGLNVEFEPRRRQDVDAIVMVAPPAIGRQFKPLFAYYYGGDLPVYSPSIVYEGSPDPSRDRDLNSVIFTDTPWVLAEDNAFRDAAVGAFQSIQGQLGRLFALGADAYQLSSRLPLLQQIPNSTVAGQTGTLTMAADGSIHRAQLWSQFRNGKPSALPDTTTKE